MSRVYFIEAVGAGAIKVGLTEDPLRRLNALQGGTFHELRLIASRPGDYGVEYATKRRFSADQIRGEWFRETPALLAVACGDVPMPREVDHLPPDADPLLRRVLLFIERRPICATTFGGLAAGNPGLISSLRKGKHASPEMRRRVEAFLSDSEAA